MSWTDSTRAQVDEDLRTAAAVDDPAVLRALVERVAARAHAVLDSYDAATAPPRPRSAPNQCPACRHGTWHDEQRGCLGYNPTPGLVPRSAQCGCKARSDGRA